MPRAGVFIVQDMPNRFVRRKLKLTKRAVARVDRLVYPAVLLAAEADAEKLPMLRVRPASITAARPPRAGPAPSLRLDHEFCYRLPESHSDQPVFLAMAGLVSLSTQSTATMPSAPQDLRSGLQAINVITCVP
jgi:hypothetical protein